MKTELRVVSTEVKLADKPRKVIKSYDSTLHHLHGLQIHTHFHNPQLVQTLSNRSTNWM